MRSIQSTCLACCVLFFSFTPALLHAALTDLDFTVTTDKPSYLPGEDLYVLVTATNTSDSPVTAVWSSSLQSYFVMDDYDSRKYGVWLTVITRRTIAAHDSYTWTHEHRWNHYAPGPGEHTLQGVVVGGGSSPSVTFSIIPEPASGAAIGFVLLVLSNLRRWR
jgi:hypothetical protein